MCAAHQMPAMALLDRDGVYGAPRFHLAMKKLDLKAHIGAEITSLLPGARMPDRTASARASAVRFARGLSEPLPADNAHEIARAEVSGCSTAPAQQPNEDTVSCIRRQSASVTDLSEFAAGLICLTGGDEGPLAYALAHGGMEAGRSTLEQLIDDLRTRECLCRTAASLQPRAGSAQSGGHRVGAQPATAAAGDARRAICQAGRAPDSGCLHLHSQPSHARYSRTTAGAQQRALHQNAATDAAVVCRSA